MAKKMLHFQLQAAKDDPGCLNLNFFKVPKDEKTRKEWANSIKNYFKTDIEFKKCSYVCAKHFEAECFNYGGLCKVVRLKKGYCPTIFEEVEQIASIQNSPSDLLTDDEMDTSSKECTVPLSPTNSANDVRISITKDLPENNVINTTTQLDDCQSGAEDDFMNPEQVEKESEVNRSFSDSSNIVQETVMKNFFRKSIVNINLDSIDLNNTSLVRRLLENAQAEVRTLRRNRRIQSMKLYRAKKRVKSSDSLMFHMKQRNLISEKVSKILNL